MNELFQLISVHYKEFWREPGIIFWAILFPILMALGLGMAFTKKAEMEKKVAIVGNIQQFTPDNLGVKDEEGQLRIKAGNEKIGTTEYEFVPTTWEDAIMMLKRGQVNLIVDGTGDKLIYHFDPGNPDAQITYLQLSSQIKGVSLELLGTEVEVLEQEGTRYIDYLVPGLMAMGIMMNCLWGIGYTNVDKRNKKLMRRMVATPMKKSNYLLAQLISRITLSAVEAFLLVAFTIWFFNVTIQGSLLAVILLFLSGNVAFAGIATLVSSRTDNSQVANGLINLVVLPMMILSGIYFSYHNFPDFMIAFIRLLPLTILADAMRNVFLEGTGLMESITPVLILITIGVVFFISGLRVFKWY